MNKNPSTYRNLTLILLIIFSFGLGDPASRPSSDSWRSSVQDAIRAAKQDDESLSQTTVSLQSRGFSGWSPDSGFPIENLNRLRNASEEDRALYLHMWLVVPRLNHELIKIWLISGDPDGVLLANQVPLLSKRSAVIKLYDDRVKNGYISEKETRQKAILRNIDALNTSWCAQAVFVLGSEVDFYPFFVMDHPDAKLNVSSESRRQVHDIFDNWYKAHGREMIWNEENHQFTAKDGGPFIIPPFELQEATTRDSENTR